MQIHELTKRRKRTDEAGLLSGFKDAVAAAKTSYNTGKERTGSSLAGAGLALSNLGKAATSPTFAAVSSRDADAAAGNATYDRMAKKYGWSTLPASGSTPAAGPAQSEVAKVTKEITSSPEFISLADVLPDPGKYLIVKTKNGGTGYKDENGSWFVDANTKGGGAELKPVTDEKTVKYLNGIIDSDQYTQGDGPGPVKEARNPLVKRSAASVVRGIIQKNNKELAKNLNNPAVQAASTKLDMIAKTRGMAAKSKKKKMVSAAQAMAKAVVGAGGNQAQAGQPQAGQGQQATNQGGNASPAQKQLAAQTITNKAKVDGNLLAKAASVDPQVKQALDVIRKESLEHRLQEALQLLSEEQVHITKDIIIRTPKGNYVKSAKDQQWRDPNGTVIDPVKYADYIKKLDATPMAQTQYQADAQKAAKGTSPGGTDTGFQAQQAATQQQAAQQSTQQAQEIKQHVPDVDPVAVAAYKQQLMAQLRQGQVSSLNSQIQDTLTQLRNAQIFGTGQEQYLQQQLAGLMATKV